MIDHRHMPLGLYVRQGKGGSLIVSYCKRCLELTPASSMMYFKMSTTDHERECPQPKFDPADRL